VTELVTAAPAEIVDAQWYADRVNEAWQSTVGGIIDMGRWLVEAKDRLAHGEFGRIFAEHPEAVERPVPFGARSGQRLMAVASHPVLANATYMSNLPPAWGTLYHLAHMSEPALLAAIEAGEVYPELEQGDAYKLSRFAKRNGTPPASEIGTGPATSGRTGPGWVVHLGEFQRELAGLVDAVDLIVADPPYSDDALTLYGDLAEWAARALRPGGVCAVYSGNYRLPEQLELLREHLSYRWTFSIDVSAGSHARFSAVNVTQWWKPLLVMYREPWKAPAWGPDVLISAGREKDAHPWQQNAGPVRDLIERYSAPSWVVADPFLGSGTTGHAAIDLGRTFIGCDVDPVCVADFEP
jgi:hypothetical protein